MICHIGADRRCCILAGCTSAFFGISIGNGSGCTAIMPDLLRLELMAMRSLEPRLLQELPALPQPTSAQLWDTLTQFEDACTYP